jgi:hypothetical protein
MWLERTGLLDANNPCEYSASDARFGSGGLASAPFVRRHPPTVARGPTGATRRGTAAGRPTSANAAICRMESTPTS